MIMTESNTLRIVDLLKENYDYNVNFLNYNNPFELLIATILSAQCTDERVNIVTKSLFKKYKNIEDYANANLEEFMLDIKSTGFYRNKAKNIIETANIILNDFNKKVPDNINDLIKLKGVARKTANVVLHHAFNKDVGIAIDTHVKRLSNRLGFTKENNPDKIEQDLLKIIPKEDWGKINVLLISHGRKTCKAINPNCNNCFLNKICPSVNSFNKE
jgi:endonuclease-3